MINKYSFGGQNITNPITKGRKILYLLALSMFSIGIITLSTYALYNNELITGINKIEAGQVKMSYTEVNELTLNNALPMKDEEGKKLNNYFDFTVSSYIKTKTDDSNGQILKYNIILEPITVTDSLNDNEIKVYLTKIENGTEAEVTKPITIKNLNKYILKSQEETFKNNQGETKTYYRIRAWIDYQADANKFNEKNYKYKFKINVSTVKDYALDFARATVGTNGLAIVTHEIDDTLQVDDRFATEYRYQGQEVKNYVTFNNELWRIIGIIPTDDGTGYVENRLKIVRQEKIGVTEWNGCELGGIICTTTNTMKNDWTGSTLNKQLNTTFLQMANETSRNMIGTTKYYLGGYCIPKGGINKEDSIFNLWKYERKKANDNDGIYYGENQKDGTKYMNSTNDTSKGALIYMSDYLLSNNSSYKSWMSHMYNNDNPAWTLTTISDVLDEEWAIDVGPGMAVFALWDNRIMYVTESLSVFPTVTLSSDVKISGGEGTSSSPYQLSQ